MWLGKGKASWSVVVGGAKTWSMGRIEVFPSASGKGWLDRR